SFCQEGLVEARLLQLGENFGSDATAHKQPTYGQKLESGVPCRLTVDIHKEIKRLLCQWALTRQAVPGDNCRAVAGANFFGQPGFFRSLSGIAKKLINVPEPRTGEDAFQAYVSPLLVQMLQKFNLQVPYWSKVGMAALARERTVDLAVPVKAGLPQSGSSG